MGVDVICAGGPRDGWTGHILHGRRISFPVEPKADYVITDAMDGDGRRIAIPADPETERT